MTLGADVYGEVYEKGEFVCREGDPGEIMYIIQSGAVEVSHRKGGQEIALAILEQGDFFGEMALLDREPRSATVKTISRTRLLPLTRESFLSRVGADSRVSFHLIKALSQRIERTTRLLRDKLEEEDGLGGNPGEAAPLSRNGTPAAANPKVLEGKRTLAAANPIVETALPLDEKGLLAFSDLASPGQPCFCYEPGQVILRQGEPSSCMYLILQGAVALRQEWEGEEIQVARLEPCDFFGEIALLTGLPYAATAVAAERTCLRPLQIGPLLERVQKDPELALYIVRALILRLRQSLKALADLEGSVAAVRLCLPPLIKKKGRISLAAVSLSSCGGCSAAFLDDQQELEKLLDRAHFAYCTMLMDQGELKEADVALVEGIARVKEDEEKLKEARNKCRFLVAWGTCAAFGGIPAMANLFELEELIEESYGETLDPMSYYLSGARGLQRFIYQAQEFGLLRKAYSADHFVRVDYYLPGCPPPINLLTRLIGDLTGEAPAQEPRQIVCAECDRKPRKVNLQSLEVFTHGRAEPQRCFLSLGTVCLGALSKGGCGAICPRGGLPCWGCRGPSSMVLKKMAQGDTYQEVILHSLTQRSQLGEDKMKGVIKLLRTRANSALNFEQNLVTDLARLR